MRLKEVLEYLKEHIECENWYLGRIDENQAYCIGIFPTQGPVQTVPIGGIKNASYVHKAVSILVHWGGQFSPAEEKANEIFNLIYGQEFEIAGKQVVMVDFRTESPVWIGAKEGNHEFVINFVIYYRKDDKEWQE